MRERANETAGEYEASKQDGPRGGTKNETLQGHDETRGQAADTARPAIVFSSPHVGKETRTTAPRPYNVFSKQGQGIEAPPDERIKTMFFKSRKSNKQKSYKNEAAIPVQFYTNQNGETCFRETAQGDYKIGRDGRVIRRR